MPYSPFKWMTGVALVLALATALSVVGCGDKTHGAPHPSTSPSSKPEAGDSYELRYALDEFTFMTTRFEPRGDVVAESGLPRVFAAVIVRVNPAGRQVTFDAAKLSQGDDVAGECGPEVDNGMLVRNDFRHRQTLRLAADVDPISPRYGGVVALEDYSPAQDGSLCWLAVDRSRITMMVIVARP
jgi:hypothetical protein